MSTVALFTLIAILCEVSAQNVTTSLLIPDGLFNPGPWSQNFTGQTSVSGHTTYYTLDCGDYRDPDVNFWPGPFGCSDNSYTISADAANTQFLVPNITYNKDYWYGTATTDLSKLDLSQLESFTQTVTINCPPPVNSTASCVVTSLFNDENTSDKSMISPTVVTQSTYYLESSFYPIIITANAAATPANTLASATTANPIRPKSSTSSSPSASSSSSTLAHSTLSTGAKAGIGIAVPLGFLALAGIALLLYSHNNHKRRSRTSQTENLMEHQGGGGAGELYERKEVGAPDNSGVYEMQGGELPVQMGELESPHVPHAPHVQE